METSVKLSTLKRNIPRFRSDYEGWKLALHLGICRFRVVQKVLEVTMRDGNVKFILSKINAFQIPVLEVTMRDGNCSLLYNSTILSVLEVTMRDGNAAWGDSPPFLFFCFRSDYEGWKYTYSMLLNNSLVNLIVLEVTMRDGNEK